MPIKKGDKIKVDYTGTLNNGQMFDSSERAGHPLEFEVGAGHIIKGFDSAVIGMKKGETKEIKLKPEEAYGMQKPELLKKLPRDKLPKEPEPKAGMLLTIATADGHKFPARIADVNEKEITIDLNHPLAGKNLNFKIKIVEC